MSYPEEALSEKGPVDLEQLTRNVDHLANCITLLGGSIRQLQQQVEWIEDRMVGLPDVGRDLRVPPPIRDTRIR